MSDTAVAAPGTAYVEANWGAWKARCIRPDCTNAMQVDRGQAAVTCEGLDGCGATADLAWPADPDAIEVLLLMRPVPRTRNWLPGESLDDLMVENAEHDLIPPRWFGLSAAAGGSLPLLETLDDRVVGGLLHTELVAAGRREIGA
jgi:hypothetical protein